MKKARRIAIYPSKGYKNPKGVFLYDASPIENLECDDDENCLANWGTEDDDIILYCSDGYDMERMVELFQKSKKGWYAIILDSEDSEYTYRVMVPPNFKYGDPIYFNLDEYIVEYK